MMRWWQLVNDVVHSNKLAITVVILHCSLQSTVFQLHNTAIDISHILAVSGPSVWNSLLPTLHVSSTTLGHSIAY